MIDRGKVIRPLQAKLNEVKADGLDVMLCSTEIIENAISMLKEQETVVRCKDCKKRYTEECGLRLTYMPQDDMFYCAAGRKKFSEMEK